MIVLVYSPQISKYFFKLKPFSLALNNRLNLLTFLGKRLLSLSCNWTECIIDEFSSDISMPLSYLFLYYMLDSTFLTNTSTLRVTDLENYSREFCIFFGEVYSFVWPYLSIFHRSDRFLPVNISEFC
jgi:hypothetical protein